MNGFDTGNLYPILSAALQEVMPQGYFQEAAHCFEVMFDIFGIKSQWNTLE
jgi:hypothetical protein